MIEEDYERESTKDGLYLMENHYQMISEYQEWEEEQRKKRLPAIIQVVMIPTGKPKKEMSNNTYLLKNTK